MQASSATHCTFTSPLAVLALAAATSRMKVKLPGINGNMSVNLPFLLTAVVNLSAAEAVVITCVSTAVQCWPRKNAKFNPQQMAFNLSMMAFASSLASLMFHAEWLHATQTEFEHAGTGARDRYPVPGTDCSGGRHRGAERRKSGWSDLVEPGSTFIPLLRCQRRSDLDGAGREFAPGMGTGACGLPGDVRDSPLVSAVLQPARGSFATARHGPSGRSGSLETTQTMESGGMRHAHATFFFWLRSSGLHANLKVQRR